MTETTKWLTVPEFAEVLGIEAGDVRDKVRERKIIAVRRGPNETWQIPEDFIVPGAVSPHIIPTLRGTLTLLADAGFSDEQSIDWLFTHAEELDKTPMEALREGQRAPVRRLVQALL